LSSYSPLLARSEMVTATIFMVGSLSFQRDLKEKRSEAKR